MQIEKLNPQVVGIDFPWFDHTLVLERFPQDNESMRIQESGYSGGGKVATALVATSRLGIPSALVAVLGTDRRERFLYEDFEANEVDLAHVRIEEGFRSGSSVVISDAVSKGRRILWQSPSNFDALTRADVDAAADYINQAKFIHLCRMDDVGCYAADLAKAKGTKVCFDADFFDESIAANLHRIDLLIASEEFHQDMFSQRPTVDTLKQLAMHGPKTVVITLGSDGGVVFDQGRLETYAANAGGINIVDTVGAGDVFHGAYLAAQCRGYSALDSAKYASATAGLKCGAMGGRTGIPTHDIVQKLLDTGVADQSYLSERQMLYSDLSYRIFA